MILIVGVYWVHNNFFSRLGIFIKENLYRIWLYYIWSLKTLCLANLLWQQMYFKLNDLYFNNYTWIRFFFQSCHVIYVYNRVQWKFIIMYSCNLLQASLKNTYFSQLASLLHSVTWRFVKHKHCKTHLYVNKTDFFLNDAFPR